MSPRDTLVIMLVAILSIGMIGAVSAETAEQESNDDFDSAQEISEGVVTGKIVGGESDFYQLEANTTDALDVQVTADRGNIDLRIFDPDRNEVAGDGFTGSGSRSVIIKAPETGTFFIEVAGDDQQTTSNYTLNVDRVTPVENDGFAPNDNFKSATVIADRFTSAQIWGGESDFYRVGLNASEGLKVEVRADGGEIDLRIFDPNLEVVARDAFGGSGERNVTVRASESGTYFIEITGDDQQTTTGYQFQSNRTGLLPEPASPAAEYADPDTGVVKADGLLAAAADFRAGEIEADQLLDVAAAFRLGNPIR